MLFTPIKPMNISDGEAAFDDDEFIFEPKWDGARIILHKQGERVEAFDRHGTNITGKFPELAEAVAAIQLHSAVLDCEGIVLRAGRPVFDDFVYRTQISRSLKIKHAPQTHPATFVAFDVLYADRSTLELPLMERKRLLNEIVNPTSVLLPTVFVEGLGHSMYELTGRNRMEGIVAKRKTSVYVPGLRSQDWIKIKHARQIDVLILGYRIDPFQLVIGLNFRTVRNKPVGTVENGLTPQHKEYLIREAASLHTGYDRTVHWLKPELCCRIQYADRTEAHQLMKTEFCHFLPDKEPAACVWQS